MLSEELVLSIEARKYAYGGKVEEARAPVQTRPKCGIVAFSELGCNLHMNLRLF